MFALTIDALIDSINAKTKEDLSPKSLLYALVPNAEFGYLEDSSGTFETQSEYDALIWTDERAKPSWQELENIRQTVFDKELAIDLDQVRQMRFSQTTINFNGLDFQANPSMIGLLDSQIEYHKLINSNEIPIPQADKRIIRLSLENAEALLSQLRSRVNKWILDPRLP